MSTGIRGWLARRGLYMGGKRYTGSWIEFAREIVQPEPSRLFAYPDKLPSTIFDQSKFVEGHQSFDLLYTIRGASSNAIVVAFPNPLTDIVVVKMANLQVIEGAGGTRTLDIGCGVSVDSSGDNIFDGVDISEQTSFQNISDGGANSTLYQLWPPGSHLTVTQAGADGTPEDFVAILMLSCSVFSSEFFFKLATELE